MPTPKDLRGARSPLRLATLLLLSTALTACPDSLQPPKKPPPGPQSPDVPHVPAPKAAETHVFHGPACPTPPWLISDSPGVRT